MTWSFPRNCRNWKDVQGGLRPIFTSRGEKQLFVISWILAMQEPKLGLEKLMLSSHVASAQKLVLTQPLFPQSFILGQFES